MPDYEVTLWVEGTEKASIEKKLTDAFGEEQDFEIKEAKYASHAVRLQHAEALVEEAVGIIGDLKSEMEELEEELATEELGTLQAELGDVDFSKVNFPETSE